MAIETPRTREGLAQLMLDLQDEAAETKDPATSALLAAAAAALDGVLYPAPRRYALPPVNQWRGTPAPRPARAGAR